MNAAPGPYNTVDVGCGAGFHTYIIDRNGRKIGVAWGPRAEKVWTAALFAAAHDMRLVLTEVEAVMSIVEPRSDKAEYLNCLDHVRRAIAKAEGVNEGASPHKETGVTT